MSKRLAYIAGLIPDNKFIADIGTDHGYLPIILLKNNQKMRIIATDINQKPLEKGFKNLQEANLFADNVNFIQTDGLKNLPLLDLDYIIIAGLGGTKISKIINHQPYQKIYILNPTNNFYRVRKTLLKNNFKILTEKLIYENNYFNLIITAKKIHYFNFNFLKGWKFYFQGIYWKTADPVIDLYLDSQLKHLSTLLKKTNNNKLNRELKYIIKIINYRKKENINES